MKAEKIGSIIVLAILATGMGTPVFAYNALTGTTGAAVLKIPVGVRAMAMGEAYTAVADDVNSIYWNPAGLAKVQKREVNFSYNMWLADMGYGNIGYAQYIDKIGTLAGSLNYLYMGAFTGRDVLGNLTADFTGYSLIGDISYARRIMNISAGANIKLLQEQIEAEGAFTCAVDAGVLYDLNEKLAFGLAVQNIGPGIRYTTGTRTESLPLAVRTGISYRPFERLLLGLDINFPFDNAINVSVGMEYRVISNFAIRAGYKTNRISDLGVLSGLCAGFGLNWGSNSVDFAYTPFGEIGNCFRLSMGMSF